MPRRFKKSDEVPRPGAGTLIDLGLLSLASLFPRRRRCTLRINRRQTSLRIPGLDWLDFWWIEVSGHKAGYIRTSRRHVDGVFVVIGINIDEEYRRMGLGRSIYLALAAYYGTLESDYKASDTMKMARGMWAKIPGATRLPGGRFRVKGRQGQDTAGLESTISY